MALRPARLYRYWQRVERSLKVYAALRNMLAVIAVIVAILAPKSWLLVVVLWLAVAWSLLPGAQTIWSTIRTKTQPAPLLGTVGAARINVVLAAAVAASGRFGAWWDVIACGLLVLLGIAEQVMRRPVRSARPWVANLPEFEVPLPSPFVANLLYWVSSFGALLAVITATVGLPAFVLLAVVLVGVVIAGVIAVQMVRYLLGRYRFEENLPKILNKLKPTFAFHWQAPAGTAYQAAMWLPYLERIGSPFFVLVRTAANLREVAPLTSAPVILRVELTDLDSILTKSLKAVFYANTAVRNSHMIRFPYLTHIQLNHGDSDKIASVSPTFRQYDKNFVAGQAAIDRFAKHGVATHAGQFVIVGRPQLEHVQVATRAIGQIEGQRVLYSPTWSGFYADSDYSSLIAGADIVQGLLDRGCTVIFRPHPYARRHKGNSAACDAVIALLEADEKATGRQHVYGEQAETTWSIVDCFNNADAMISDVSSVVSDFLISGKPFAMCAVSAHGAAFTHEFPLAEAAYVIDIQGEQAVELTPTLAAMLGPDPMAETRRSMRDYYLSDTPPERVAEHFVEQARRFVV